MQIVGLFDALDLMKTFAGANPDDLKSAQPLEAYVTGVQERHLLRPCGFDLLDLGPQ